MRISRVRNHPHKMGISVTLKNQTSQEQQSTKNQTSLEQQKTKNRTRIVQETTCLCTFYEPAQHKK